MAIIESRFPTAVIRGHLEQPVLSDFCKLTDELLTTGDRWNYAHALAGRVTRGAQLQIPPLDACFNLVHERARLFSLLLEAGRVYLREAVNAPESATFWGQQHLSLDDAWCVSQREGDYNPLHGHEGLLSGVLYVKVPPRSSDSQDRQGFLSFMHSDPRTECIRPDLAKYRLFDFVQGGIAGTCRPPAERVWVAPIVGDYWIFPSWLLHEVLPFSGPGERRSIAFNLRVDENSQTELQEQWQVGAEKTDDEGRRQRLVLFAEPGGAYFDEY